MTVDLILEKVLTSDHFVVADQRIFKWALSLVTHMINRHLRFFSDLIDQSSGNSGTQPGSGSLKSASNGNTGQGQN